jgi:8-oxo-dGTP diphosphatase
MATLVLLRHAKALDRVDWLGEDEDRPLNNLGQEQAKRMARIYVQYGIEKMYTSDAVRCIDTVKEMSEVLDIEMKITKHISEYVYNKKPDRAVEYAKELMYADIKEDRNILICSHNPVLPHMLQRLLKHSKVEPEVKHLKPGEAWVLEFKKKKCLKIDHIPAPIIAGANQEI